MYLLVPLHVHYIRIRSIAESLGYKPNAVAKSLAVRNKKIKIGVVIQQNDYFDYIEQGMIKAQNEIIDFGITVSIIKSTTFDLQEQLTAIETILTKNIKALVIAPVNHPEIRKKITEIQKKGIHVIFLTRTCENAPFTSYVGCNYARMGELSAGLIHLFHSSKGNICLFAPQLSAPEHKIRVDSFTKTIQCHYSHLNVKTICELNNDEIDNYKATLSTLQQNADTDIVLYTNGAVKGGYQAIKEFSTKKPLKVIGYDLFDTVKEGLLDNSIAATISQLPEEQGYKSIMVLFNYLVKDEPITEKYHYIEPQILIKENIQ